MNQTPRLLKSVIVALIAISGTVLHAAVTKPPNVVLILADDLGYADLGCYGAKDIRTPNIDRLAGEGMRFTDFYGECVCTPARSSLMTGSYPKRVGLNHGVIRPGMKIGLNPDEVTVAELLKSRGYATACIGKWHLGEIPELLPTAQGFDSFFGMPGPNHGKSDLYRNTEVIEKNADVRKDLLTRRYTDEAIRFIQESKDKPFFLYLAQSAIHIPLFASEKFRDKSAAGLYGDMTEELDWSCGEVLKTLKELNLDKNTLVIFTSDNGPYARPAPPLHGGKGSTWEAGSREPCIFRWPGKIAAGSVCHEIASLRDIAPTLAAIVGASMPADRTCDGHNILPLLTGEPGAKSQTLQTCYYSRGGTLSAIREGDWKLHLVEPEETWWGTIANGGLLETKPSTPPPWLYNLHDDVGETHNVAAEHPDIVARLQKEALDFDHDLDAHIRPAYNAGGTAANTSNPE